MTDLNGQAQLATASGGLRFFGPIKDSITVMLTVLEVEKKIHLPRQQTEFNSSPLRTTVVYDDGVFFLVCVSTEATERGCSSDSYTEALCVEAVEDGSLEPRGLQA